MLVVSCLIWKSDAVFAPMIQVHVGQLTFPGVVLCIPEFVAYELCVPIVLGQFSSPGVLLCVPEMQEYLTPQAKSSLLLCCPLTKKL